ncbi:unnamed protein product [Parajaminaea phylloscopi]
MFAGYNIGPSYDATGLPFGAPPGHQPHLGPGLSAATGIYAPAQQTHQSLQYADRNEHASGHGEEGSPKAQADEDGDDGDGQGKRRRVQRACDVCRRKKIRCDGLQPGRQACTNCITYGHDCKFEEAAKRRAPPRAYVEALEARMEKVERLLSELAPGVDFTDRIGPPVQLPEDKDKDDSPRGAGASSGSAGSGLARNELAHCVLPADPAEREKFVAKLGGRVPIKSEDADEDSDGSYNDDEIALVQTCERPSENLADFKIMIRGRADEETPTTPASRVSDEEKKALLSQDSVSFLGNSNTIHLVHGLEKMRGQENVLQQLFTAMRPEFWKLPITLVDPPIAQDRRKEALDAITAQVWPPLDLERKLLDLYFARINNDYPIVSESSFRAELTDPANRRDTDWVMLAMSIFAVASRYVDDDRVLDHSRSNDALINTRGAKYYNACRSISFCPITPSPSLRWTQMMLLCTVYVLSTSLAQNVGWNMLGTVFRVLHFAGAHRKLTAARMQFPVMTHETWRRVWWTAYSLERELSTILGRPAAVQDEDFDVEPPLEVDDKYIAVAQERDTTPSQPAKKPALISGFTCSLKLDEIMGRTLRTIYAIGKAKISRGLVGKGWDQLIVAEIDSSLNHWLETVPKHLRYNQAEANDEWLLQSSLLYCKYYYCQILVHRPFIAGPKMSSSLNYPSLAITTNAAKSTIQVLHTLLKRGLVNLGGHMVAGRTFEAGCVLLVVISGSKKNGLRVPSSTHSDIKKCFEVLSALEERWSLAGKLTDLFTVLCKAFEVDALPSSKGALLPKRKAHGEDTSSQPSSTEGSRDDVYARPTRGGRRSEHGSGEERRPLPLSTKDLGLSPPSSDPGTSSGPTQVSQSSSPKAVGDTSLPPAYDLTQARPDLQGHVATQAPQQQQQQQQQTPWYLSAPPVTSPRNDFGLSTFGADLDQDTFASFVNSMNAPTFTPLDLPTFSSAFFAQTPGANCASLPQGGESVEVSRSSIPSTNSAGQLLTPGLGGAFFGGFDLGGGTRSQPSATPMPSQSSQTPGDPFNNVFQDLWASQDFFSGNQ